MDSYSLDVNRQLLVSVDVANRFCWIPASENAK